MDKNFKIDKTNTEEIYALTPLQHGMLFHHLKDPDDGSYLVKLFIYIEGNPDIEIFNKTWQELIKQNEILRTIFRWDGLKEPVQIVLKNIPLLIEIIDISDKYKTQKNTEKVILDSEKQFEINLTHSPFSVSLYKTEDKKYTIVISHHHILYDGWSTGILVNDFFRVYNGITNNTPIDIIPKARYIDYIKNLKQQDLNANNHFWKKQLENYTNEAGLQDTKKANPTDESNEYIAKMEPVLYNNILGYSKLKKVTVASVLYAAWGIVLQKGTNSDDIVFGTTVSGRNVKLRNIENTIGLFINTVPLRITSSSENTLNDIVTRTNAVLNERQDYENSSLADIKKLQTGDPNEELFDSLVIIENYPLDINKINTSDTIKVTSYKIIEKTHYDLALTIKLFENPEIHFAFNPGYFSGYRISQLHSQFIKVIETIVNNPESKVSEMEIISAKEKYKVLNEFNQTFLDYNQDATLGELLDNIANENNDREILFFGNEKITYKQLLQKSDRLANVLRNKGVSNNSIVGIMVNRSIEMIISLFAVLKSGAAYVPIDPEFPQDRINYMIINSGLRIMLSDEANTKRAKEINESIEIINVLDKNNYLDIETAPAAIKKSNSPAYVIYTSGTTGNPKGVIISHRNVVNFIEGIVSKIEFSAKDKILALTTISFDIFVLETFLPILKGIQVVIANEGEQNEPELLCQLIRQQNITMLQITPSRLKLLMSYDEELESFKNLRVLMLGGEALPEKLFAGLKQKFNGLIYNLYGPTETTVWSTLKNLTNDTHVTIGKPIANTSIFILDKNNKLQPLGFPGELCIGGEGVGIGYFKNEGLTAQKFFIDKELSKTPIYRTGDVARWLDDGNIECLGRIDNQVKIRGYRIEIDEIETVLSGYKDIKDPVVISNTDKDDIAYLCAYYTSDVNIDPQVLTNYLANKLPEYMVPSYFIKIDSIPLTPNGKVNRRALPKPDFNEEINFVAPENNVEKTLQIIWADVLNIDKGQISVNANFFKLGGHSLKSTSLSARIFKHFNYRFPIKDVYTFPTIKQQARQINHTGKKENISIPRVKKQDFYPLTSSQERLFILHQLDENFVVYNMPGLFFSQLYIEKETVENIINQLIARHDIFRSSFEIIDNKPVQKIHDALILNVETFNISANSKLGIEIQIEEIYKNFIRPFSLKKPPLLRVGLIHDEQQSTYLMFDMHHIISDGASIEILLDEFSKLYNNIELPKLPISYKDYCCWYNNFKNQGGYIDQQKHWLKQLEGNLPVLDIPVDFERPLIQDYEGYSYSFTLNNKIFDELRENLQNKEFSTFMILLGAVNILLSKLGNCEDIIIGTTIAGRNNEELEHLAGMFVNTIPLRNFPSAELSFAEFLENVKSSSLSAFENQNIQLEDLIDKLKVKRNPSRNPVFDVLFNFQYSSGHKNNILTEVKSERAVSKFDLTFDCLEKENSVEIRLEYAVKLFTQETIKRFAGYLAKIINTVVANPGIKLGEIEMISDKEKDLIINTFNNTLHLFRENITLPALFEEQVDLYPNNIALQYKDKRYTYSELDNKANQIKAFLINNDVKPGDIVGIVGERSLELVAGIFGILKAGAAYLPIDKNNPVKRINYLLEDSKARLLLIPHNNFVIDECAIKTFYLDNEEIYQCSPERTKEQITPDNLAYVIYTSGSTGIPKGVMIEHKQAVNLLYSLDNLYPLGENDSYLFKTPCVFDVSVSELFGWFLHGGKLNILPEGNEKDPLNILEIIQQSKVTHVNFVPSLFNTFVTVLNNNNCSYLESLKYIFLAGEPVIPSSILQFRKLNNTIKLENLYGPTEATVYASYCHLEDWDGKSAIPIGKPLHNVKLFILNRQNNINSIGIEGELCISGKGLARGYLNNKKLSGEKFIDHPFIKGEKLYKTGDLAKWLPDGNTEFIGRIDQQVKVRGYRIELGEIENKLRELDGFTDVVVNALKLDDGDYTICSYIVSEKEIEPKKIKKQLSKELPEYMIPVHYIKLDKIPLNANNKIDRKALPKPTFENNTGIIKPVNETESIIADVWADVLNTDINNIGTTSNFFDLGGHSLKGTILLHKIEQVTGIRLPLSVLFKYPTIQGLARQLGSGPGPFDRISIIKKENREYYPLSPYQKRIYVLQEFDAGSKVYNMPARFEIRGPLDILKFELAFNKIIERHKILKAGFYIKDNTPFQKINDKAAGFKIDIINANEENPDEIFNSFIKPFRLDNPPLLRIKLIKVKNDYHILFVDFHHIIFDGVSAEIMISDLNKLYHNTELYELQIQYTDFAAWCENKDYSVQKNYWANEFASSIPSLNIRTDYERPTTKTFAGDVFNFTCSTELISKVKGIARSENLTVNIVILAAYTVFISKLAGQEDIVIGIPVSCRQEFTLHDMIGMFVNTIAIRSNPDKEKTFRQYIHDVKEKVLNGIRHQDYPFDKLIGDLKIKTQNNRNPLFDVAFSYERKDALEKNEFHEISIIPAEYKNTISRFDLTLFAIELENNINFSFEYSTELFSKDTISLMKDRFNELLINICNDYSKTIGAIDYKTSYEKELLKKTEEVNFDF